MKKFLLLSLAVMLLPVAMTAQSLRTTTLTGFLQRAGVVQTFDSRHKAPAQIDLESNQKILGHYDSDAVQVGGYLGLTSFAGTNPIAIELTPDELAMFQGGKIVAFRVGISVSTPVTRVFVAPSSSAGLGEFTEWTCNVSDEGWNLIPVDPPYEINLDENTSLMVGFDYQQTSSNYPLSYVEEGDEFYPSFVYLTYQGQTGWFDIGTEGYGNLSLQCIVESDNYPAYMLKIAQLSGAKFAKAGDMLDYNFKIKNQGTETVEAGAVTFDVTLDGEKVDSYTNPAAFGSKLVSVSGSISTEGLEPGNHKVAVTLVSLNGEALETPQTLEHEFKIFTSIFPRQKHLLEQFTSNSCTYCPLGTSMIEVLQGMRDDIARVAIHGNMSTTDPTNTKQCDTIFSYVGCGGWPYGCFDRTTGWEDDATIANGLGYNTTYHQQVATALGAFYDDITNNMPTFASINLDSEINPLTREATVTVSGEITPDFDVMMGEDAKLTVYITEDSIIYRQLNNGRWTSKYRHDGVLRQALGTVFGVDLNKQEGDSTYCNDFALTIPAAWNIEKLNVIAFISRPLRNGQTRVYTDMYVNNTEMAPMYVLPATAAPEITFETTDEEVFITATGEGEVLLYVNGELVENPYTIARGEEDVVITVVATAQDGDKLMNTTTVEFTVPAIVEEAVNEILSIKTVESVRYFNMMGQEMTSANGATLVITTYTDGTTTATKVMK